MMDDHLWIFVGAHLIVGMLIGVAVGVKVNNEIWRRECIKHNAAQYHQQTGRFEWIEQEQPCPTQ